MDDLCEAYKNKAYTTNYNNHIFKNLATSQDI